MRKNSFNIEAMINLLVQREGLDACGIMSMARSDGYWTNIYETVALIAEAEDMGLIVDVRGCYYLG